MNEDLDFGETEARSLLVAFLEKDGWNIPSHELRSHGVDIAAVKGKENWMIEVKGCGSLNPMRVNYFLSIIGEIAQRMSSPSCKYSIAFPYRKQYLGLWDRLPQLAKERLQLTMILIGKTGYVEYH